MYRRTSSNSTPASPFAIGRTAALAAAVAALLFVLGCAGPTQISVPPGQGVNLALGHEAVITGEPLKIRFAEVLNDSRCPTGATCVWEGEVSARLEITYRDSNYAKVVVQPGLTDGLSRAEFKDYVLRFRVQPYPEVGRQINKNDYRLQLIVDKKPPLTGGILVTFDVVGETYRIFVTNEQTIDDVYAALRGESQATIPSGRLVRGAVAYNAPWTWHIDPEDIHMAEVTIELCDGRPSMVEEDLDYWVDTVGRFCPWSARIVKVEDFR